MRAAMAAVDEVERWLEEELRCGRFQPNEVFPPERVLCKRLRVSRGAVREAKARLHGRGILVRDRWRSLFASRDAATVFRDWLNELKEGASAADESTFDFWRLILPEIIALAVRRASDEELATLASLMEELTLTIAIRAAPDEIEAQHACLVTCASTLAKSPSLNALAMGLLEAMQASPVWEAAHSLCSDWQELLQNVASSARARNAAAARAFLRKNLYRLKPRSHDGRHR
jgi:DNA-binding FadR family transcriptional regulator